VDFDKMNRLTELAIRVSRVAFLNGRHPAFAAHCFTLVGNEKLQSGEQMGAPTSAGVSARQNKFFPRGLNCSLQIEAGIIFFRFFNPPFTPDDATRPH
jgi:hypothetical protein